MPPIMRPISFEKNFLFGSLPLGIRFFGRHGAKSTPDMRSTTSLRARAKARTNGDVSLPSIGDIQLRKLANNNNTPCPLQPGVGVSTCFARDGYVAIEKTCSSRSADSVPDVVEPPIG